MSARAFLLLTLLLAACGQPKPVAEKPAPPPAKAASAASTSVLTPQGWGPIRIGMPADEAMEALGAPKGSASLAFGCTMVASHGTGNFIVMFDDGKVARIEARAGKAPVLTDTGLTLGATKEEVRAKYPDGLQDEPHKYEPAPAGYLTWWNAAENDGIRYVTGADGKVNQIIVGGPAIRLVEGCS